MGFLNTWSKTYNTIPENFGLCKNMLFRKGPETGDDTSKSIGLFTGVSVTLTIVASKSSSETDVLSSDKLEVRKDHINILSFPLSKPTSHKSFIMIQLIYM